MAVRIVRLHDGKRGAMTVQQDQHDHGKHENTRRHVDAAAADDAADALTAVDPVWGMKAATTRAKHRLEHDGRTTFFCSGGCLAKFRAEPARYAQQKAGAKTSARPPVRTGPTDVEYTCPMHPQIVQKGPGACP